MIFHFERRARQNQYLHERLSPQHHSPSFLLSTKQIDLVHHPQALAMYSPLSQAILQVLTRFRYVKATRPSRAHEPFPQHADFQLARQNQLPTNNQLRLLVGS
ncbi:MAG: hypothetical protein V7K25_19105 [Nostoc sp.]|uniref:hypothetical protein n=1 Tax=Nostoc sp. TaxID=1180 RepID=UPI002FF6413E